MTVEITTRQVGEVTVMDVEGLLVEDGPAILRDATRGLVAQNKKRILINLAKVTYTNSAGIGALVAGFTRATNNCGQLKLLNLNRRLKGFIQVYHLYTVFDVHEDEAAAIRAFAT